ncbi:MAG: 4-hydroxythreonine-4-phosphate dehydrogenase PdxA [Betaproteobacteria bacterium]
MPAARPAVICISSGEPAGIGPDICLALARRDFGARIVVLGDRTLLAQRAGQIGTATTLRDFDASTLHAAGTIEVCHVALQTPGVSGQLNTANSPYVLELLRQGMNGCLEGKYAALVTAPVHKGVINDAGIAFTGHTEFFAAGARARVVMMLVGGGLRVALATTHLALKDVPLAITADGLAETLRVLAAELSRHFGLARPRILVAGLNPHGGEGGHFGREEIEVINPVLAKLRDEGLDLVGPLPADTLFTPAVLRGGDCVLAMYHDQGLPVLKYASFGGGVNVTLGLPFIRTSVDHGTALDLAGSGRADPGSLFAAVEMAVEMVSQSAAGA